MVTPKLVFTFADQPRAWTNVGVQEVVSNLEATHMPLPPAVSCTGCGFAWNSAVMAEGLRLLGSCPKCGGELAFREDVPAEPRVTRTSGPVGPGERAPHLVLGIPRR